MVLIGILRYFKSKVNRQQLKLTQEVTFSEQHLALDAAPIVSILIPTRDRIDLLRDCIDSIVERTTYRNYEIIVVDNDSREEKTVRYLSEIRARGITVIRYPFKFNYSKICNLAASKSRGEYLCFLNNDTEVTSPDWLQSMLEHASRDEVGVVGSKLLYPDGRIQHVGVVLGYDGVAGHAHSGLAENTSLELLGYRSCFQVSAVTFACAMVKRVNFESMGGLDESFRVGLNDIDYCLRSAQNGLINVICSKSILVHKESQSRHSAKSWRGAGLAIVEVIRFIRRHGVELGSEKFFAVDKKPIG